MGNQRKVDTLQDISVEAVHKYHMHMPILSVADFGHGVVNAEDPLRALGSLANLLPWLYLARAMTDSRI